MIDPRAAIIDRRLSNIARIIGFSSAKGGVGKTTCASIAGIVCAGAGRRIGMLDLDLQGASAHVFLGITPRLPAEDRGMLPIPVAANLWFMGAAMFVGERAFALRGPDVTDALLEMLAVTRWGELDYLFIDMPPGIGDEALDLVRLVPRLEALVISTPETVSVSVVGRLLGFLQDVRVPVAGVIANMVRGNSLAVRDLALRAGAPFIGELPFDPGLEHAVGDPVRLARTRTAAEITRALAAARIM